MTKLLNLDTLGKEPRTLVIDGVEHVVEDMSVENFIKTTKVAEQLAESNAPLSEQVAAASDLIHRAVPTLSVERLSKLPVRHLQTIVAFVRGDEVEEQTEQASATSKPAAKKAARKS